MSDAPTAHIDLKARTAAFKMQISSVKRMLVGLRNTMSTVSRHAKRMLLIGGGAITGLLFLAGKQADAEAKLEAVLQATGNAAGYTAAQLKHMAAEMQKVTRYGDEAIMPIQALLLTFKEIKGPIFRDAMMSILDMATVMGTDLKSAALQLGKALNDPILGVTALSRMGIQFTETQKKQIKAFVETNRVMKAQVIILKEIEGQMGGAATRAAKTFTGQIVQLKNSLGDLGEQIGFAFGNRSRGQDPEKQGVSFNDNAQEPRKPSRRFVQIAVSGVLSPILPRERLLHSFQTSQNLSPVCEAPYHRSSIG